jgi:hypothetical protein
MLMKYAAFGVLSSISNYMVARLVAFLPTVGFLTLAYSFKTIVCIGFQSWVAGRKLTDIRLIACILLLCFFSVLAIPDLFKSFLRRNMDILFFSSGFFSLSSVSAFLLQESLLKDSQKIMMTNALCSAISVLLHIFSILIFAFLYPANGLFSGLESFWLRIIPFISAFCGILTSFILYYADNISLLSWTGIAVLIFNMISGIINGDSILNLFFLIGFILLILALVLNKLGTMGSSQEKSRLRAQDDLDDLEARNSQNSKTAPISLNEQMFVLVIGAAVAYWFLSSPLELKTNKAPGFFIGEESVDQCKLYEVPITDPHSNLLKAPKFSTTSSAQFSSMDINTGNVFVSCPESNLYFLSPDTTEARGNPNFDEVSHSFSFPGYLFYSILSSVATDSSFTIITSAVKYFSSEFNDSSSGFNLPATTLVCCGELWWERFTLLLVMVRFLSR